MNIPAPAYIVLTSLLFVLYVSAASAVLALCAWSARAAWLRLFSYPALPRTLPFDGSSSPLPAYYSSTSPNMSAFSSFARPSPATLPGSFSSSLRVSPSTLPGSVNSSATNVVSGNGSPMLLEYRTRVLEASSVLVL